MHTVTPATTAQDGALDRGAPQRWGSLEPARQRHGQPPAVSQYQRAPFHAALLRAREAAYAPGEYVGQESFMQAAEIRELAGRARVGPGVSVLDLCCGVGGPGRLLAADLRCRYLGLDCSASALAIARQLADELPCRFTQAHLPPLPDDRFDVVLLLETMLAFPDKAALVAEVAHVLVPGGRFAFTLEEGRPLEKSERARMPDAGSVWLVELSQLTGILGDVGLTVTWRKDCTASHAATAATLLHSFRSDSVDIARQIGRQPLGELLTAHHQWTEWLAGGRVRKFAMVAEKQ